MTRGMPALVYPWYFGALRKRLEAELSPRITLAQHMAMSMWLN